MKRKIGFKIIKINKQTSHKKKTWPFLSRDEELRDDRSKSAKKLKNFEEKTKEKREGLLCKTDLLWK